MRLGAPGLPYHTHRGQLRLLPERDTCCAAWRSAVAVHDAVERLGLLLAIKLRSSGGCAICAVVLGDLAPVTARARITLGHASPSERALPVLVPFSQKWVMYLQLNFSEMLANFPGILGWPLAKPKLRSKVI